MKKLAWMLSLAAGIASAQSTRAVFENSGPPFGADVAPIVRFEVLSNGNFLVLSGMAFSQNRPAQLAVVSPIGAVLNSVTVNGLGASPMAPADLEIDGSGNVYVFGTTGQTAASADRFMIRKFNSSLAPLNNVAWTPLQGDPELQMVDGEVFTSGEIYTSGIAKPIADRNLAVTRIGANFGLLWNISVGNDVRIHKVEPISAGGLMLAITYGDTPYLAQVPPGANVVYNQVLNNGDAGEAIDVTARNGKFTVLAAKIVAGKQTVVRARRYSETSALEWTHDYTVAANDTVVASGIEATTIGSEVILGGSRKSGSGATKPWVRRLSSTGTLVSEKVATAAADISFNFEFMADVFGNVYLFQRRSASQVQLCSFSATLGDLLVTNYSFGASDAGAIFNTRVIPSSGTVVNTRSIPGSPNYTRMTAFLQMPRAAADAYSMPKNTTMNATRSVLSNDWYAGGATTTVDMAPAQGTLVLNSNGTFTYTPPTNFTGTVTFRYQAAKPNLSPSVGTVTITVQ
jgi:hypothetical protein